MLKIGEFSRLAQVSTKTLRLYDERGLLRPAWTDRFTGYRYYAAEQLARLHRILALKDLGFSLEEIGELLDGGLSRAALERMMRARQHDLAQHIAVEQARLARIEARLAQMAQSDGLPQYEVVLKRIQPLTVAGMRRSLPSPAALPGLLRSFQQTARRVGLPDGAPILGVYYDADYREADIDLELAVPLTGETAVAGSLQVHELPGVDLMACTVHRGAYQTLPQAYEALLTWLDGRGYRPCGPNRDLFLQTAVEGAAAESAVTEVQFPVQPTPFQSTVAKTKEKQEMETTIKTIPAFTVVGLPYFGSNEGNNDLPALWDALNQRVPEIKHRTGPAYGLCQEAQADGRFRYLAGFAVSEAGQLPDGMEAWSLPEQTYAVFPCDLSTIHQTYQYAFETWLPQSAYRYNHGTDFELYDEAFDPETGTGIMYIYIPVEKKGSV